MANPIIRWDIGPGEHLPDVLEAAGAHLAAEGRRIISWAEYAGELILTVTDPEPADPASRRQTRVQKPPVTR